MAAFNRIIAKSKIENQSEITMELAEDALKDIINPDKPKEITPELIIEVVAEHFGVSPGRYYFQKTELRIRSAASGCHVSVQEADGYFLCQYWQTARQKRPHYNYPRCE